MNKSKVLLILAVIVALFAVLFIRTSKEVLETPVAEEQVFCAADVSECPDGSYVGRVAPSCEFAACPGN